MYELESNTASSTMALISVQEYVFYGFFFKINKTRFYVFFLKSRQKTYKTFSSVFST